MNFYPLTFTPLFKDRIWGGSKLHSYLNKPIDSERTGESWEISSVPGDVSVVNTGVLQGKSLNEIIDSYPEQLLGTDAMKRFGLQFPLLFKFIDAKEDLSIQLHPNDELAKIRHNSFGKTEMWYVMQADEGARLVVGFKNDSNQHEYLEKVAAKDLVSLLNEYPVKQGDVFFLATGTIHAIGAGVVVAEIQQTSDVTYRIYDWDRVGADGKERALHTELALEAINYAATPSKVAYDEVPNQSATVVDSPFFVTNIIALQDHFLWKKTKDAFTVFMCTKGHFELVCNGEISRYQMGDTVLIPAIINELTLKGTATLLEISI